jgi:hypothetical protein
VVFIVKAGAGVELPAELNEDRLRLLQKKNLDAINHSVYAGWFFVLYGFTITGSPTVSKTFGVGSILAFHTNGCISNIGSGNGLQNHFNISSILITYAT